MPHYRLYFLNGRSQILKAMDLECRDDEEALTTIAEHRRKHHLELWQGRRLIGRFPKGEGLA